MTQARSRPVLVKLGGSLITDKSGVATVRGDVLTRLAEEIAAVRRENADLALVVGHGSGSFGHVAAAAHGIGRRSLAGEDDLLGAARTAVAAARLHRLVVEALVDAGVPALSFPPSSWLAARDSRVETSTIEPLLTALEGGFLPVVCGDVVPDRDRGASIASTEAVFEELTDALAERDLTPRLAVWMGVTDGVLDAAGATVAELDRRILAGVRAAVGGSAGTDVTGGMVLRVEAALGLAGRGVESRIVDGRRPGALRSILHGTFPGGTRIRAERD